ncbi:hypothetical protein ABFZ85_08920 [Hyphococcus formosus]|uniref:hypothetical protein n=1 Tax=Hyphococcus formosus TaxID=3143534 RepID=UPI00398ACA9A
MGWLDIADFSRLWAEISALPDYVFVSLLLLGILIYFFSYLVGSLFWLPFRKRKASFSMGEVKKLTIESHKDKAKPIKIHSSIFGESGWLIPLGGRAEVSGLKEGGEGRLPIIGNDIVELWSHRRDEKADVIFLTPQLIENFFPGQNKTDGDEVWLGIKPSDLKGFARYWNHEDDGKKFSNRFAVYLTMVILFIELGFPIILTLAGF